MTPNEDPNVAIARTFIAAIPHSRALGMELDEIGEGVAVISMPYDARFVGDARTSLRADAQLRRFRAAARL